MLKNYLGPVMFVETLSENERIDLEEDFRLFLTLFIDRITNKQSVTLFCVFVYDFSVYC